jgi:hypothetical protein
MDEMSHMHGAIEELFTRAAAHSGWLHRTPPFQVGVEIPSRANRSAAVLLKDKLLKLWNFSENPKKLIPFRNKLIIIVAIYQRELKHKA